MPKQAKRSLLAAYSTQSLFRHVDFDVEIDAKKFGEAHRGLGLFAARVAILTCAAGDRPRNHLIHLRRFETVRHDDGIPVIFIQLIDLGCHHPITRRGVRAVADVPAPACPFANDLIREFRVAVFQDAIAAVERARRVDITLGDKFPAVGR